MLHYIQKRINFVSISMFKIFSKFSFLVLGLISMFWFTGFYSNSYATEPQIFGSVTQSRECPFKLTGLSGASVDGVGSTYSSDVGCTCQINQCRLSSASNLIGTQNKEGITANLKFICIPSTPSNDPNPPTIQNDGRQSTYDGLDITEYADYTYWRTVAGASGENGSVSSSYYLDIFSSDTTKQIIPLGATCRTNAQDPNGVAYWYYPGYFNIIQGKKPTNTAITSCGGENGSNILFSNKDLFGNEVGGTQTLFGCLPNSLNGFVAFIVRLVSGLSIAIAFLIILINLVKIISSSTNPDAVAEAQKKMAAAFFTLVGILLTITILSIFGLQIIGFGNEGLGGAVFKFFVGG